MRGGQFAQALTLHEESLALNRSLGDQWGIARELVYLGLIHWTRGDYAIARPLAEEGLTRCRATGDPQRIAQALQALGWIRFAQDDLAGGRALFAESVTLCRAQADSAGMGRALPGLAWVLTQQGEYAQAHTLLSEVWFTLKALGDRYHLASCLSIFSHLALRLQQPQRAVRLLSAVDILRAGIGGAWPAFIRSQLERNLALLRSQLPEAEFATAWAAGQSLRLDEIAVHFPTLPLPPTAPPPALAATYPAGLTEREVEVLRLLAQGLTNAQIAEKLIVSPYTVNAHLRTIYGKLEVTTRAAATRFALEHGLVEPSV
jgi:DNA-binding NarL/FixJ family response regulator